eukprot:4439718-Pleurochrysis_carterae.AAC.1
MFSLLTLTTNLDARSSEAPSRPFAPRLRPSFFRSPPAPASLRLESVCAALSRQAPTQASIVSSKARHCDGPYWST